MEGIWAGKESNGFFATFCFGVQNKMHDVGTLRKEQGYTIEELDSECNPRAMCRIRCSHAVSGETMSLKESCCSITGSEWFGASKKKARAPRLT